MSGTSFIHLWDKKANWFLEKDIFQSVKRSPGEKIRHNLDLGRSSYTQPAPTMKAAQGPGRNVFL